jgi:hypothetical protein
MVIEMTAATTYETAPATRRFWATLSTRQLVGIRARVFDNFEQGGALQAWYDAREADLRFLDALINK